jgi:uncharacterized protein YaeQ
MALPARTQRFRIQLSHVDIGLYTELDLRVAQHPSETERYLLTRVLAYCFLASDEVDSVLQFSKGGVSSDEPALARVSLDGRLLVWCEVGTPAFTRVHKASKAAPRVVLFTHNDPKLLAAELAKGHVHRKNELEVFALDSGFLDQLASKLIARSVDFALTLSEGQLYFDVNGETLQGVLQPIALSAPKGP